MFYWQYIVLSCSIYLLAKLSKVLVSVENLISLLTKLGFSYLKFMCFRLHCFFYILIFVSFFLFAFFFFFLSIEFTEFHRFIINKISVMFSKIFCFLIFFFKPHLIENFGFCRWNCTILKQVHYLI